jgi:hypothetical protein
MNAYEYHPHPIYGFLPLGSARIPVRCRLVGADRMRRTGPAARVPVFRRSSSRLTRTSASMMRTSIPNDILIGNWFWRGERAEVEIQELGLKQFFGNTTPDVNQRGNYGERLKYSRRYAAGRHRHRRYEEANIGRISSGDFLAAPTFSGRATGSLINTRSAPECPPTPSSALHNCCVAMTVRTDDSYTAS